MVPVLILLKSTQGFRASLKMAGCRHDHHLSQQRQAEEWKTAGKVRRIQDQWRFYAPCVINVLFQTGTVSMFVLFAL